MPPALSPATATDCDDTPSRSALANAQRVTRSQSSSPAGYGSSGASRYPTETTIAPEPCASSRGDVVHEPDAAEAVAAAPVILWNADHHWVSFLKQFGRARIENFRPAFLGELIPTQFAFATPLVFILGAMGLHALIWRNAGAFAARMLVNTMFWTIVAYFIWHSLHARVEANWFAPVYPAMAIAAAVAAHLTRCGQSAGSASPISACAGPRRWELCCLRF